MITKEKLLSKAVRQGECLVWAKHINRSGYGSVWSGGKNRDAHRVSYELHHGPIPQGMCVMHSCDNRACIEPSHLSIGTRTENMQDMANKGRASKVSGESHSLSKLTPSQVAEIRRRYTPYDRKNSSCAMAREFGVNQSTLWSALKARTWKEA